MRISNWSLSAAAALGLTPLAASAQATYSSAAGRDASAVQETKAAEPPTTSQEEASAPKVLANDRQANGTKPDVIPAEQTIYPSGASGLGIRVGRYLATRWGEDWSFLRDHPGVLPPDRFDPLKFIPIAADGQVYLTLSNEERLRLNYTTSPAAKAGRDQDQELIRNIFGADLHLGDHFRVYGEFNSAQELGSNKGAVSPTQRNDLVVQQLFGEARTQVGGALVGVMVGRQEFWDGPPNIVHIRPATNVYIAMDGVRLYANWSKFRVALFSFRSAALGTNAFDDGTDDSERFKGVNTSFIVPGFTTPIGQAKLFFDPFYYRYRNDARKWGAVTGQEQRNFYGSRLWGTVGPLSMDVTGLRQDGNFAGRDISAWAVFSNFGYMLSRTGGKPTIGVHVDHTSGGGAFQNGKLHDFNFIFGSIPYFSWGNFVGPTNLQAIAPNFTVEVLPKVRLTTEVEFLRRPNDRDAVYNNLGLPYAGTQNVRGHRIGTLLRANASWALNPHLSVGIKTDYLVAGTALTSAGYSNSLFLGPELSFRF